MTLSAPEYDTATPSISLDNGQESLTAAVSSEKEISIPLQSDTSSFYSLISLSGMTKTPVSVSKFVGSSFSSIKNVQAVLAGESADILHVWVMIDEWTPGVRKSVYAVQRTVMKQVEGLHFDFYVIDLPLGTRPEEMVSDIPVIFNRANQDPASTDCSR
jgi:hypothetical protein